MKTLKERRPKVYQLLTELGCEFKQVVEIDIDNIHIDQGIYPREKTDQHRIELYAENMENGDKFPPIIVADTNNVAFKFALLDGNHRLYAAKLIGESSITAEIWEVPENLYPIVAQAVNTEEGNIDTPLTPAEKKKAILRDWEILAHIPKTERKKKIAQVLRTTVAYVDKVLSDAGVIKSEKEELRKRAEELKEKGYTYPQISEKLNIPVPTLKRWFSKKVSKFTEVKNDTPPLPESYAKFSQQKNATPQPTPQNLTPEQILEEAHQIWLEDDNQTDKQIWNKLCEKYGNIEQIISKADFVYKLQEKCGYMLFEDEQFAKQIDEECGVYDNWEVETEEIEDVEEQINQPEELEEPPEEPPKKKSNGGRGKDDTKFNAYRQILTHLTNPYPDLEWLKMREGEEYVIQAMKALVYYIYTGITEPPAEELHKQVKEGFYDDFVKFKFKDGKEV